MANLGSAEGRTDTSTKIKSTVLNLILILITFNVRITRVYLATHSLEKCKFLRTLTNVFSCLKHIYSSMLIKFLYLTVEISIQILNLISISI